MNLRIKGYSSFNESKKKINFKKEIIDDFIIYYGRDAESNDYVTQEMANNENDIFLHAHKYPGSQVIIKVKDKIPTKEVIEKAAIIAAKNSKSKENVVNVVYCKKKFVAEFVDIFCFVCYIMYIRV